MNLTDNFNQRVSQLPMFRTEPFPPLQLLRPCCQKSSGMGTKIYRWCSKISAPFSKPPPPASLPSAGYSHFLPVTARFISTFRPSHPTAHLIVLHSSQHTFPCFVLTGLYFERQKTTSGILLVSARAPEHT